MSLVTLSQLQLHYPKNPSVFYRNRRTTATTHPKCRSRFRVKPLRPTLVEEARPHTLPPVRGAIEDSSDFLRLGSVGLKLWIDQLQLQGQLDQNKRSRAIELRETFTKLGPAFAKISQGLSTRPDLYPPEFLEELSKLHDALPTFLDAEAFT
ncbi:hypothetical protein L1887_29568 [Cichorium endivia]|nr:hypothetical protein L1887_29568 [Cichorium endivia]